MEKELAQILNGRIVIPSLNLVAEKVHCSACDRSFYTYIPLNAKTKISVCPICSTGSGTKFKSLQICKIKNLLKCR